MSYASQHINLMQRLIIETYLVSITNGQIERVHSTIFAIAPCLMEEYNLVSDIETILRDTQ